MVHSPAGGRVRAYVVFRLANGSTEWLRNGDEIGRSPEAAIHLASRKVSEAAARVSHRSRGLTLLSLRGLLVLKSQPVTEVLLEAGQVFHFADGSTVEVVEVHNTDAAFTSDPTEKVEWRAVRLVARHDTATLSGGDLDRPLVLNGVKAAILIELVKFGEPVGWYKVARLIWAKPREQDRADHKADIRARWDQAVHRIRRSLEQAELGRDLISCRAGTVSLALLPGDEVVDLSEDEDAPQVA